MKTCAIRSFLLCVVLPACFPLCSRAADFLLTMDDLPIQPLHGLAHPTGIEFGFTVGGVPSDDASYASGGPGNLTFVQDPSIEGNSAGVLFISFPEPTPLIRFGVARSVGTPSSMIVELFNASNVSLGVRDLALTPMPTFAEGLFIYRGQAVNRLTVAFPLPNVGRFALDNLYFRIVPEPTSVLPAVIAGIAIGLRSRRRRSATEY